MAIEFDYLRGVRQGKSRIEICAQARRIDAASARVAGVAHHGQADLDLGIGEPVGIEALAAERRKLIVGRAQTVIVGLGDLLDHIPGTTIKTAAVDPEKAVVRSRVIVEEDRLLLLARPACCREPGRKAVLNGNAHRLQGIGFDLAGIRFGGMRPRTPTAPKTAQFR